MSGSASKGRGRGKGGQREALGPPEPTRSLRYLTLPEVQALHIAIMERTDSAPQPLLNPGGLESAILRPQYAAHYEGADLLRQAVVLVVGISQAQAYLEGNKRTAFAAADVFLRVNGCTFRGEPLRFAQHLVAVAESSPARAEAEALLEAYLRAHTRCA